MRSISSIIEECQRQLAFDFIRTSGPGGQNINKVATGVQLTFDIRRSASLDAEAKRRLTALAGRRVSGDGVLLIRAERRRTQAGNRADAVLRFVDLLERALTPPKKRLKTKASAASKERRLQEKKRRSAIKSTRRDQSYE